MSGASGQLRRVRVRQGHIGADLPPGLTILPSGALQLSGYGPAAQVLRADLSLLQSAPCLPPGATVACMAEWSVDAFDGLLADRDTGHVRIERPIADDGVSRLRYDECLAGFGHLAESLAQPSGMHPQALYQTLCGSNGSPWCVVLRFLSGQGGITDPMETVSELLDALAPDDVWVPEQLLERAREDLAEGASTASGSVLAVCLATLIRETADRAGLTSSPVDETAQAEFGWSSPERRLTAVSRLPGGLPPSVDLASPLMLVGRVGRNEAIGTLRFTPKAQDGRVYRIYGSFGGPFIDITTRNGSGFVEAAASGQLAAVFAGAVH